jgi:hypothetical protein
MRALNLPSVAIAHAKIEVHYFSKWLLTFNI